MSDKPTVQATHAQIADLEMIYAFIRHANILYQNLPGPLQDQIHEIHNESTTLGHCLRWAEKHSEEIVDLAKAHSKTATNRRPR